MPSEDLTIANLLYQSSGFTNDEARYPSAQKEMTLEDSVRSITNCELAFYPSSQFSYVNANYNILGYLIEVISGQSYEIFMSEKILSPLGLHNTYANPAIAESTGTVVFGSRVAFFQSHPYEIPVNIASVPAGYIYSDIHDMGRWLQIQMETFEVTEQFTRLIKKSHILDKGAAVDTQTNYASGWFVKNDGTIYHSGGTPNYSSRVMFNSDSGLGVCVLTNINACANTELMSESVIATLEVKEPPSYRADVWIIFDTIFSILTFACMPLLLLIIITLVQTIVRKRKGQRIKTKWNKKSALLLCIPIVLILISTAIVFVLPVIFGDSWAGIAIWAPYSLYTGTITFVLCSLGILAVVILKSIWRQV